MVNLFLPVFTPRFSFDSLNENAHYRRLTCTTTTSFSEQRSFFYLSIYLSISCEGKDACVCINGDLYVLYSQWAVFNLEIWGLSWYCRFQRMKESDRAWTWCQEEQTLRSCSLNHTTLGTILKWMEYRLQVITHIKIRWPFS